MSRGEKWISGGKVWQAVYLVVVSCGKAWQVVGGDMWIPHLKCSNSSHFSSANGPLNRVF